jgi:transcriptional regulator with XRE-family HTH domain
VIATSKLRDARKAHGWSQNRLVREIEIYAEKRRLNVASTASLRVYVSEWENEKRSVSESYASILRALLGRTDYELFNADNTTGAPDVDGYDALVQRIDSAHALSVSMVDTFLAQTELLRTQDRQLGAHSLVDQMNAHLNTLQDALTFAVLPNARRPLATALAGAATLAAWQALDVGAADRAWRNYELGKRAAQEAGDVLYLAHAMGEQAFVLSDAGKPDLAVELVREAQRVGGRRLSPRLRAWLFAAEAEVTAVAGEVESAKRALEKSMTAMPETDETRDPDMASIFLNSSHLARWRSHTAALLGEEEAIGDIYEVLNSMDPTFARARAGLHCDLAHAHLLRGEYADADTQIRSARMIANRTGSVRFRRRVAQLIKTGHNVS